VSGAYDALMARRNEILLRASGLDYERLGAGDSPAFDYEGLMNGIGYAPDEVARIQAQTGVGRTPLIELPNLTRLARRLAGRGRGARIFVKDEACNPSGSFKDRRASVSAHHARARGYKGLVAATSGNYGAAVASQAARQGLRSIIVQEAFDSAGRGQPEILEKARKCEALGAEVLQTSVGPELFYVLLAVLEETGYFNASLYTPFSVGGIETLGAEIAVQTRELAGREPDAVLVTHAGGGNVTGVARGLRAAGAPSEVIGVSVDLSKLHMASDRDFNRKSFTTGHTGFSIPFTSWPDRVDVPRNAARPLRYLDRLVTVTQGEVFYVTELLARLEGQERGPAGNTSLAAALVIAQERDQDELLVDSETEYTGAGKSPVAQLEFAIEMGVEVSNGDPRENVPGERIVVPTAPEQLGVVDVDLERLRGSYLRRARERAGRPLDAQEVAFLVADSRAQEEVVRSMVGGAT
jgi:cysteine synthase